MLPDITNYIPDPNNGRPIANGQVYFFIDGYTPPTNINDVNPAYVAEVTAGGAVLPQPIYTTQGGVLRTGSLANMPQVNVSTLVKRVAVYDKCGALIYSTAYNGIGAFVDVDALAATDSDVLVGGVPAANIGRAKFDTVNIMDYIPAALWGSIRDYTNAVDLTSYMQAAHETGRIVHYPAGRYKFSTLTMLSGGITGEYKFTILDSTDTTTGNVITHLGRDPYGLLVNELGAYFADFYLRVDSSSQKPSGAGIYIDSGASNENYTSYIGGVTVRNIPTCLRATNASFMTIERNYFALYKEFGIYLDNDYEAFGDNGDNIIANNSMFTNLGGFSIKYRTGGGRFIGNKINGGVVGIDISPLRDSSIILIEGNSIENQSINAIRFVTEDDADATDYTQVLILGNQIGGYNLLGNAFQINPTAYSLKNLQVCNNIILSPTVDTNAIDVRNTDRFTIANNTIDCLNTGFGGVFVSANATNGKLIDNEVYRFTNNHTQNLSSTTIETRVINSVDTLYTVPSIASLSQQTLEITVAGCIIGDKVSVSMSVGNSGSILTGYVSATDTVTISWFNPTGSAINLGAVTVNTKVSK